MTTRYLPLHYRDSSGNFVQMSYTDTVNSYKPLDAYPVGSYYITNSAGASPASLFGGTWTQLAGGYTLVSSSGTTAITTGGGNTKTLTAAMLPKVTGWARMRGATPWGSTGDSTNRIKPVSSAGGALSVSDLTDASWWQHSLNGDISIANGQNLSLTIGSDSPSTLNVQQLYRTAKIYYRTA